ncbi:MAG TPA: hypothetical protein VHF06_05865 [Pseudonocardiaceae bacterium]|nr:hypothetical protein [Pseudonocardiaceae bacterium]
MPLDALTYEWDVPPTLDPSTDVQIAIVQGSPDAATCGQDVIQRPVNDISFHDVNVGMQVCVLDSYDKQLVLMTLAAKSEDTYGLSWTATGWSIRGNS